MRINKQVNFVFFSEITKYGNYNVSFIGLLEQVDKLRKFLFRCNKRKRERPLIHFELNFSLFCNAVTDSAGRGLSTEQ